MIEVVLSGALDDGAAGLAAIALRGVLALVQRSVGATVRGRKFAGMPRAALVEVPAAPAAHLARLITDLVGQPVPEVDGPCVYDSSPAMIVLAMSSRGTPASAARNRSVA